MPVLADPYPVPAGRVARGRVRVPSSKSVTHRVLALAVLGREPVRVQRPLLAGDTELFLDALPALGMEVRRREEAVELAPRAPAQRARIECGNAGTLMRFLTGLCTVVPGEWTLDGTARLRERPVGPLVDCLRQLGAEIEWLGNPGTPPLRIRGGTLRGGEARLDAGESSQYLSAAALAALGAPAPVRLELAGLTSAPYVEVTLDLVAAWGGSGRWEGRRVTVDPGLQPPVEWEVEPDWSAAAYPAAAAALTGGSVVLEGVRVASPQGDRRFLEVLERMGAEVEREPEGVRVSGSGALAAVDEDLGGMPDQVPTLAALAPFARGRSVIRNVPHLRLKESDRLRALRVELGRLGAEVAELEDGLALEGAWAEGAPETPVTVDSWGDHRVAMSLALVGLRRPGVRVERPEVVGKSYPAFWRDLAELLR